MERNVSINFEVSIWRSVKFYSIDVRYVVSCGVFREFHCRAQMKLCNKNTANVLHWRIPHRICHFIWMASICWRISKQKVKIKMRFVTHSNGIEWNGNGVDWSGMECGYCILFMRGSGKNAHGIPRWNCCSFCAALRKIYATLWFPCGWFIDLFLFFVYINECDLVLAAFVYIPFFLYYGIAVDPTPYLVRQQISRAFSII